MSATLAPMSRHGVRAEGATMWWKRKKLEHLHAELAALAIRDRLFSDRPDVTQNDLAACAMRQRRQAELLAEIARLDLMAQRIGEHN